MEQRLRYLPLGTESWVELRQKHLLFVDKTAHLAELTKGSNLFLARPYGFGKTLLLAQLQELFAHGAKDNPAFAGMAVQADWHHRILPVVKLSLLGLTHPATLAQDLGERLCAAFAAAGFTQAHALKASGLSLPEILGELEVMTYQSDLICLIDDWDFSLSAQLQNQSAFESNCKVLRQFKAWLRELPNLWFTLFMGARRFQSSSLWGGEDVRDLSLDPAYADLLGYSEEELTTYFADYLDEAAARLNLTQEELIGQLRRHYGGFCFDQAERIKVYCPLAINRFLSQVVGSDHAQTIPSFGDYRWDHA